jgi:hypothetical protein
LFFKCHKQKPFSLTQHSTHYSGGQEHSFGKRSITYSIARVLKFTHCLQVLASVGVCIAGGVAGGMTIAIVVMVAVGVAISPAIVGVRRML